MARGNETLYGGGGGLGHMPKMAATPIYGKNPLKIFFSGTKWPVTLGLGMQHLGHKPNKVCSNNDLELTLTFFTAILILLYGRFPEGIGRQGRVESYFCNYICGAPTTSEVKGLRCDEIKE